MTTHTHTHTYTHTYDHTRRHTNIHIHTHTDDHTSNTNNITHTHTHTHTHTDTHTQTPQHPPWPLQGVVAGCESAVDDAAADWTPSRPRRAFCCPSGRGGLPNGPTWSRPRRPAA